jgi:hypothetical protein
MILWCTDGLSEQDRLAWENKVIKIKDRIDYYKADAEACGNNMLCTQNDIDKLPKKVYEAQLKENTDAFEQSSTNVRMDEIELARLEAKGPQPSLAANHSTASSSTTGMVRNISELSEIHNQGPSQKKNK